MTSRFYNIQFSLINVIKRQEIYKLFLCHALEKDKNFKYVRPTFNYKDKTATNVDHEFEIRRPIPR